MSTELVPYSFTADLLPSTQGGPLPDEIGRQGVHFTMPTEVYEQLLAKVEGWFAGRVDVSLVDHGITTKGNLGFIILEWIGVEIDTLFLAILRDEELIEDVTVYDRVAEEEEE
ncbi:MAG TPA: hypothetical protein VH593_09225 [Ktedonobacteraceae bacterium]|jgi:hypothetical protein